MPPTAEPRWKSIPHSKRRRDFAFRVKRSTNIDAHNDRAPGMTSLYDPIVLGDLKLGNRVFMAPLSLNRATPSGVPGPWTSTYYSQRASAGLIVSEATQISPMGKGCINKKDSPVRPVYCIDDRLPAGDLISGANHGKQNCHSDRSGVVVTNTTVQERIYSNG
jgi:NADH:flavin oxidoreductase / NADH oxidase family